MEEKIAGRKEQPEETVMEPERHRVQGNGAGEIRENPIEAFFCLPRQDIRTYSPLTLAFLGDGVYDLVIRTLIVEQGNTHANVLHQRTSKIVKAESQAAMIEALLPALTQEEEAVYKRGRNAKAGTKARSASLADYRKATGFEALIGYLYLEHRMERILELVKTGLTEVGFWEEERGIYE